ncbi:MAG TPA: bifunctional phosphopantothenoylcysteine decarboxylase/phosphopantothenate--cysteine ligase CoaBC [Thermomicrobiales bacterium]|jgi:phosphopantothenoylcysteine decarboxylase/phosphopantothenate--cysteine ligase|nr:bifunctional phosphopantothenoylcysteine decarboxylase/phosphopantothenate--cysteine ligase CoaBC [Thermomicrobiales bacterium]
MTALRDRHVVLAVSGGIAAYKAVDLASKLVQAGVRLDVVMTEGAQRFIQPLSFEALTRGRVHTDLWSPWTTDLAGHVTIADQAECVIVAPATANTIARLALGLSDDLLGAVHLSTVAPLLIAPAMEHHMYHHPATQGHLDTLRTRGVTFVGPEPGRLASGAMGDGRLADPATIVSALRAVLGRHGSLVGTRMTVTAGGTQEPIDPVRSITNRSSGRMGYALAQAAIDHGATLTLITAPGDQPIPWGVEVIRVTTAAEMAAAVDDAVPTTDVLVMAAAVADFTPAAASDTKIKKGSDPVLDLRLTATRDILASTDRPGMIKVGFAAETHDLLINAGEKLRRKRLDLIIANGAVATIGSTTSSATLLAPDREPDVLPAMPKEAVAEVIIDRIARMVADRAGRA